jgi:hypothetical protein
MTRMLREASAIGAQVVTTEKDAVRLSPEFRPRVLTVPVRLEVEDWSQTRRRHDRLLVGRDSPALRVGPAGQIVVFAEFRGRSVRRDLGVGKPEGRAHARHAVGLPPHPARDHLRIGENLGQVVDRPGRNALASQAASKLGLAPLQRRFGQDGGSSHRGSRSGRHWSGTRAPSPSPQDPAARKAADTARRCRSR